MVETSVKVFNNFNLYVTFTTKYFGQTQSFHFVLKIFSKPGYK